MACGAIPAAADEAAMDTAGMAPPIASAVTAPATSAVTAYSRLRHRCRRMVVCPLIDPHLAAGAAAGVADTPGDRPCRALLPCAHLAVPAIVAPWLASPVVSQPRGQPAATASASGSTAGAPASRSSL